MLYYEKYKLRRFHMKKKIVAFILIIALSVSAGQALAAQIEPISQDISDTPVTRLVLINSASPGLSVSGTTATYSLFITCISGVNSIQATLQIQQYSNGTWVDFGKSWNASASTNYLSTSGSRTVVSGGTYRLKVAITASNGTTTGSATVYS